MTPAHDHNDFEMGITHKLQFRTVIDDAGLMTNVPADFQVCHQNSFLPRNATVAFLFNNQFLCFRV